MASFCPLFVFELPNLIKIRDSKIILKKLLRVGIEHRSRIGQIRGWPSEREGGKDSDFREELIVWGIT
ncbi:hypothetical protein LguiA_007845 [Lonicera macranthoides]